MIRHGEVSAFDPSILTDGFLEQHNLVAVPLAHRPPDTIHIGSQVTGFANGAQNKVYGDVLGNIMATNGLRKVAAMAMQQAARINFELPSGYAGDIYHHNGSRDAEIFAPPQLIDRLRKVEPGSYVAFLALAPKTLFARFRPEEFGGDLYTSAQGIKGVHVTDVYGLTTSNVANLLGPQGFDGLKDGISDQRLWPTYRLLNFRVDQLPPKSPH